MARAQSVLSLVCVILCVASLATAESVSCILFPGYLSPYKTYKIKRDVKSNGECCALCAQDDRCVAWSRTPETHLCALKDDTEVLIQVSNVDSGIKYKGAAVPKLISNDVGASVILGEEVTVVKKAPTRVSARAVATSTGGTSVASVGASPDGVQTTNFVSGSGTASTSAETPTISLKASLKKERGLTPDYVIAYHKKPNYVGHVVTLYGKRVPIIGAKNGQPLCYECYPFPCFYTNGLSYDGGYVLAEFLAANTEGCCRACKEDLFCLSWWFDPLSKKCVLNSDVPHGKGHAVYSAGTVL